MSVTYPFELLQVLDSRWRANASGLPVSKSVDEDWIGIGFRIFDLPLLVKMDDVTEILPLPPTIRMPGVKFWVLGLANIRGALMPVLDIKAFLSGEATKLGKNSRILISNKNGLTAGLLVEEVFGLRRFKRDEHVSDSSVEMGSIRNYLSGVFVGQAREWNVFSVEKLVDTEDFLRVV